MPRTPPAFSALILDAWHTAHRVTCFLVENLPEELWAESLPGSRGRTIRALVAHEAHHRGQIVLAARQLGHALPASATTGLWQWTKRAKE